jgi:hypothetical protein
VVLLPAAGGGDLDDRAAPVGGMGVSLEQAVFGHCVESRSAFAKRFTRLLGQSPAAYITEPSPRMTAVILQLFVSGPHA